MIINSILHLGMHALLEIHFLSFQTVLRILVVNQCKKEGKDQESIQSSTIPDPGYQWESENDPVIVGRLIRYNCLTSSGV